jgi:hypothetical protein
VIDLDVERYRHELLRVAITETVRAEMRGARRPQSELAAVIGVSQPPRPQVANVLIGRFGLSPEA